MIFGQKKLSAKALRGVIVFTIVEFVTLTAWLLLLAPPLAHVPGAAVSAIVLAVGLFVEHYIATQVGQQDT